MDKIVDYPKDIFNPDGSLVHPKKFYSDYSNTKYKEHYYVQIEHPGVSGSRKVYMHKDAITYNLALQTWLMGYMIGSGDTEKLEEIISNYVSYQRNEAVADEREDADYGYREY